MKHSHLLSIIAASIALSACVTTATAPGMSPDKLTRPIRADDKPYIGELDEAHAKTSLIQDYHTMKVATGVRDWEVYTARSGHFTKDGAVTLFAAPLAYKTINSGEKVWHEKQATLAVIKRAPEYHSMFGIWTLDKETNEPGEKIVDLGRGCVHPRKAVVADFNQDGIDDVYTPCHGIASEGLGAEHHAADVGEKSRVVMSDGKGGFKLSEFGERGFWHGGAVADVNGDGYPDIVGSNMGGNPPVFFYINQKDGTFKKDTNRIVGGLQGKEFMTLDMFDVDGDGIVDLLVGGEVNKGGEVAVLFGDADGKFGRERLAIPHAKGRSVILGFMPVTNNSERILYVHRSSDPTSGLPGGPEQIGADATRTVQAVNLTTGKTTIAYDYILPLVGDGKRVWSEELELCSGWLPATRNGQKGITPADARYSDLFIADGKLVKSK